MSSSSASASASTGGAAASTRAGPAQPKRGGVRRPATSAAQGRLAVVGGGGASSSSAAAVSGAHDGAARAGVQPLRLDDDVVHMLNSMNDAATDAERNGSNDFLRRAVDDDDDDVPPPSRAVSEGDAAAPDALPFVPVITMPQAEMPYLMDMNKAPKYGISAFTPLWRNLKQTRSAVNNAINGFRVLINQWNKNEDKEPTHVALNQGKLHVPWGAPTDAFLAGLALSLQRGYDGYFTEIKTPWFRFFTDLDFVQPEKLSPRQIECAVFVLQQALRRFFPGKAANDPLFYAIVCSTSYKPIFKTKDDEFLYLRGEAAERKLAKLRDTLDEDTVAQLQRCVDAMPVPIAWKTGVHCCWINLFMNNDMALTVRETFIAALANAFGVRVEPMNDWGDVVDVTVFKGSGLRMLGNRKSDPCPQCKSRFRVGPPEACAQCPDACKFSCRTPLHFLPLKKKDVEEGKGIKCPTCDGNGRVDTGRPYMLLFMVDAQGYRRTELEEVYLRDFVRLLKDTSVRWRGIPRAEASEEARAKHPHDAYVYEQPRGQGWVPYKGAPLPVALKLVTDADGTERYVETEADLSRPLPRKKGGVGDGNESVKIVGGAEPRGMNVVLSRADEICALLQRFIRTNAGDMYAELRVTRVACNKERTCYFANVQGVNCNYCNNIGREHRSNRIFFMFTTEGMVQRCHDRSTVRTDEMRFGLCATYRSALVALPRDLQVRLFPKAATKASESGMLVAGGGMRDVDWLEGGGGDELREQDVTKALAFDPMRDPKMVSLLHIGDHLSMQLHGVPWSNTLMGGGGKHVVRVSEEDQNEFVERALAISATLSTGRAPSFVEVDFGSLGQRALAALQSMGFANSAPPPPDTSSQASDATPTNTRLSIQRIHAALMHQLTQVLDAAVNMPSERVEATIRLGGFNRMMEDFYVRRAETATPPAPFHERVKRVAAHALRVLHEHTHAALGVWSAAIEECTTDADRTRMEAAYAQWQQILRERPEDEMQSVELLMESMANVTGIKRRAPKLTPPTLMPAQTRKPFASLREHLEADDEGEEAIV